MVLSLVSCNTKPDEKADVLAIKSILDEQRKAWSLNDIDAFMDGYWKSDSLKFYGGNGLTRGWEPTLANYKKRYPSKAETGNLNFIIDDITRISDDAYWVMGQYHLTREVGNAHGTFLIIFKRIDGQWKIVADSSC
jgi:hypothetical protein